ncbi:MAG: efflux RND transporter periplasmic adaptor subunit [Pseudomonadota bacterium]
MALLIPNLSFSRQILPVLALIGLGGATWYVLAEIPPREITEPEAQPAKPTGALANSARVAGVGLVEPASEVIDIGSALPGLITDLRVAAGDRVEKGEPLFTIDDRAVRAGLTEADAAIAEARASIGEAAKAREIALRQLALYRELDDPAAVSKTEIIRAEGEAEIASERLRLSRARLAAAQARAGSTRTELGRLTVRAPISGEILAVNIRPGEYAATQGGGQRQPFIQMGQTNPLHVRIDVDENEAVRVKLGAEAIVSPRGAASNQVKATFVRAEPQVVPKRQLTNSASERVDVRVLQLIYALPESDDFRVGQQVDAFIAAKTSDAKAEGE